LTSRRKGKRQIKKNRKNKVGSSFGELNEGKYSVIFNPEIGLQLINEETGKTIAPTNVNSQLYYDRESRPKVVSYSDSSITPSENANHVLKNFEYLSAIDTNTRTINGRLISVSIICLGRWINEGEQTKFSFYPHLYMDIFDYIEKPERHAWCEFIKLIVKGENYEGDDNFGIIVDSELGDIPDINNRTIPLYEEFYLPEKMSLIYASSDKSDTVQNYIIKKCDQLSTERINYLEKNLEEIENTPSNYVNIGRIHMNSPE
jgi:hypothetical protein